MENIANQQQNLDFGKSDPINENPVDNKNFSDTIENYVKNHETEEEHKTHSHAEENEGGSASAKAAETYEEETTEPSEENENQNENVEEPQIDANSKYYEEIAENEETALPEDGPVGIEAPETEEYTRDNIPMEPVETDENVFERQNQHNSAEGVQRIDQDEQIAEKELTSNQARRRRDHHEDEEEKFEEEKGQNAQQIPIPNFGTESQPALAGPLDPHHSLNTDLLFFVLVAAIFFWIGRNYEYVLNTANNQKQKIQLKLTNQTNYQTLGDKPKKQKKNKKKKLPIDDEEASFPLNEMQYIDFQKDDENEQKLNLIQDDENQIYSTNQDKVIAVEEKVPKDPLKVKLVSQQGTENEPEHEENNNHFSSRYSSINDDDEDDKTIEDISAFLQEN